ncbi:hypothetical protein HDU76_009772 [Blyttiomyces sp. JEL0837]|nr:hypothetical protein HDU76_009772 [Blyttiomyces sp. JEL0837]
MQETSLTSSTPTQLRNLLQSNGYLLLRNALPRDLVIQSRQIVLEDLKQNNHILRQEPLSISTVEQQQPAPINPSSIGKFSLLDRQDLTHNPTILHLLTHPTIYNLLSTLYKTDGSKILTLDYKWLRAVPTSLNTGPHLDRVYLGAGSNRLLTIWTPFGDILAHQGGIVFAEGSHRLSKYDKLRTEYGMTPAGTDGTKSGWVTDGDPNDIQNMYGISADDDGNDDGIRWVTSDFKMGDIVVFGLDVLHMTVNNESSEWRLSCETRWQPRGDAYPPFFSAKTGNGKK